jgi:hypothetical protein
MKRDYSPNCFARRRRSSADNRVPDLAFGVADDDVNDFRGSHGVMARPIEETTDKQLYQLRLQRGSGNLLVPPNGCCLLPTVVTRAWDAKRTSGAAAAQELQSQRAQTDNKPRQAAESAPESERVILKHPGFGQSLPAGLEKRAQFDRVGPLHGKVELRAPVARDPVRNGLDKLVRSEGSARS